MNYLMIFDGGSSCWYPELESQVILFKVKTRIDAVLSRHDVYTMFYHVKDIDLDM